MKKILLFIAVIFLLKSGYSQSKKTIYLNDLYDPISLEEFERKVNTNFFTNATFSNDTAIFHKLRYREYFGKIECKKKIQLNKLFSNRYNVDTTKVWLIHYKDSLPDISKMSKKAGYIILDTLGNELTGILSWNEYVHSDKRKGWNRYLYKYLESYENFKKGIDFEKRYLKKKNKFEFLHLYGINKGYPVGLDNFNWLEDSGGVIPKVFSDGLLAYKQIVVHPDGNFYAITYSDSLDLQKRKLKYKSFLRAKKIWLREYELLKKWNE